MPQKSKHKLIFEKIRRTFTRVLSCSTRRVIPNNQSWLDFYSPYFSSAQEAIDFVEQIEAIPAGNPMHRQKILMHQTQRLVSIAIDLEKIRPRKQALQLAFLIISCENISKLFHNYEGDMQSKHYVKKFFEVFVSDEDKARLRAGFTTHEMQPMQVVQIVESLYSIRCDVVHEGKCWGFHFKEDIPMLNIDPDMNVYMSFNELRDIVVRGSINAINGYSPQTAP